MSYLSTEQNWLSSTQESFDTEVPVQQPYKGLSLGQTSSVIDQITNILEHFINDIEDHKANNENEIKQLQRLFSQFNRRGCKFKGSKDKNIEDLREEIEKLKGENMRVNPFRTMRQWCPAPLLTNY